MLERACATWTYLEPQVVLKTAAHRQRTPRSIYMYLQGNCMRKNKIKNQRMTSEQDRLWGGGGGRGFSSISNGTKIE